MGTRSKIELIPALAILASFASAANFTNPQEINLLERHTPNGSLY